MEIAKTEIDKLNELHDKITNGSKKLVLWAIEAGQILTNAKESVGHGNFIKWIENSCNFSERAAQYYISVYKYRDKTASLADLQSAYKLIESEENRKKAEEKQIIDDLIKARQKTGEKPEGWTRAHDYAWKKQQEENELRTKRLESLKQEIKENHEKKTSEKSKLDDLLNQAFEFTEKLSSESDKAKKIRLSGNDGSMISAIEIYLNELENDSRRIEACHDIIKYCKNKANEYQTLKAG